MKIKLRIYDLERHNKLILVPEHSTEAMFVELDTPTSFSKAIISPESFKWQQAKDKEMTSLKEN